MMQALKPATCSLLAALTLAGCVQSAKITEPDLNVQATSVAKDRVVGTHPLVVRTYVLDAAGKQQEVTGASCDLRSADISARTTTPRRLFLPIYVQGKRFAKRGAPAPVAVTCRGNGKTGSTRIEPLPFGTNSRNTTTSQASGTQGVSVSTTTLSTRMVSATPWTYGSAVNVVLK